jgi:hypothetical protein
VRRAPILALGLLLLVAGCPPFSPTAGYKCGPDAACPSGSICDTNSGTCRATGSPACATDADCSTAFHGSTCQGGSCVLACGTNTCAPDQVCSADQTYCVEADHTLCPQGNECPIGFRCASDGQGQQICLRPCSTPADCLPGWTCGTAPDGKARDCKPVACGPDPNAPATTQPAPFGSVSVRCQVSTGASGINGTCIGPLSNPALASQNDGLCYGDGLQTKGQACNSRAVFGDGGNQCVATLACVTPPVLSTGGGGVGAGERCQSLCGPQDAPVCASNERCWYLWADLGVCVAQKVQAAGLADGVPCSPAYGSSLSFPDTRPCAQGLLCVPDSGGASTGTCRPPCDAIPGLTGVCASAADTCHDISSLAPGAPRDLGYCAP